MVMKQTHSYKRLRLSYVQNMFPACFSTLVAGLREVHYEEYITKHFELINKCKILRCKILISYICALVENVL